MMLEAHDVIGLAATSLVLGFSLWMKRSWNKALDSLETIPMLTRELRDLADYMKENKAQIAKISVLESALQTAFKKIDELRADLKQTNESITLLRERSHELANGMAKISGRVEVMWREEAE